MKDTVKLSIPLFIRLMELAREDLKDDMAIHFIAEQISYLNGTKTDVLGMKDYQCILDILKPTK